MNKPYNSEIIRAMAEHSDECAAYVSAIKWDFWRRQKVEDVTLDDIRNDCGFCERRDLLQKSSSCADCPLYLSNQKGSCRRTITTLYGKVEDALAAKDQHAFTEAANNLYYQIRFIIDDFYKAKNQACGNCASWKKENPCRKGIISSGEKDKTCLKWSPRNKAEPKKEVFYHIGQKFNHKKYGELTLAVVPHGSGDVFFTKPDGSWVAPVIKWDGLYKDIPASVLQQHDGFGNLTLISDKK